MRNVVLTCMLLVACTLKVGAVDVYVPHTVTSNACVPGAEEYQACQIDYLFTDETYNQYCPNGGGITYILEGGKAYVFFDNVSIKHAFSLKTDPVDAVAGRNAIVYMGGIGVGLDADGNPTNSTKFSQFMLGRQSQEDDTDDTVVAIEGIEIQNIDFRVPKACNYFNHPEGEAATSNYFMNMYPSTPRLSLGFLSIENCTFQGFIRGFFRTQGTKPKFIYRVIVKDNIFYNCGGYDANGRGYAWFAGDGDRASNIFNGFLFYGNTIYDSPRTALVSDNDKDSRYYDNITWDISVCNNTFINFSNRSNDRNFFQTKYVPDNSHFTFSNNLIVNTVGEEVTRTLYTGSADIREVYGDGNLKVIAEKNYSVSCDKAHHADDAIFTGNAFSSTNNSFGKWAEEGQIEAMRVKVGSTPLFDSDLFESPRAAGDVHAAPVDIFAALRYRNSDLVKNHEIYKEEIGDPRWYSHLKFESEIQPVVADKKSAIRPIGNNIFEVGDAENVRVYDLSGRMVNVPANGNTISLEGMSKGLYIITCDGVSIKVII